MVKSFEDVSLTGISLVRCGLSYQDDGLNPAEQAGQLSFKHIWLVVWLPFLAFSHILGMSSSQLTKSYFSEGWPWPTNQIFLISGKDG